MSYTSPVDPNQSRQRRIRGQYRAFMSRLVVVVLLPARAAGRRAPPRPRRRDREASEALFRTTANEAPIMLWLCTPDGFEHVREQVVAAVHGPHDGAGTRPRLAGRRARGRPRGRPRAFLEGAEPSRTVHARVPADARRRPVPMAARPRIAAVRAQRRVPRLRRILRGRHRPQGRPRGHGDGGPLRTPHQQRRRPRLSHAGVSDAPGRVRQQRGARDHRPYAGGVLRRPVSHGQGRSPRRSPFRRDGGSGSVHPSDALHASMAASGRKDRVGRAPARARVRRGGPAHRD